MAFTQKSLQRISSSVSYTESVQRGSKAGGSKGWPRINQDQRIVKGMVVNNPITGGGSGEINVSINGVFQGPPYKTVWLDWLGSEGDDITVDRKVIAEYIMDEDIWTITGADCEPELLPGPPGHGNDINLTTFGAGTIQGTAKEMGFKSNRITETTATNNAVRLPSNVAQEDYCHIRNDDLAGGDAIQVFPATGGFINNLSVNVAESIASGTGKMYTQVEADHWISS